MIRSALKIDVLEKQRVGIERENRKCVIIMALIYSHFIGFRIYYIFINSFKLKELDEIVED